MIDNHPNATAAAGAGGTTILAVWIARKLGLDLDPLEAATAVAAATTAFLFIGRRGLRGLARILWRGDPQL